MEGTVCDVVPTESMFRCPRWWIAVVVVHRLTLPVLSSSETTGCSE